MADDSRIFTHMMQKSIGNAEYRREIVIIEEGPFVFRVVQEHHLNRVEGGPKVKPMWPGVLSRSEWICPTKEAATEQALRCLYESKRDHWLLSPSASSAA